jgi:hypothetical protein
MDKHSRGEGPHDVGAAITGTAPVSGGFAIACGLLFATTVVLALVSGLSWSTVGSTFGAFAITTLAWQRFKASDLEYRQRMERLDQRLRGEQ